MAVSILLPTFNGEPFIEDQLNSIATQTLDDYELLIADDGSTDATRSIVARAASRDRRIRVLETQGNLGQKQRLRQLAGAARHALIAVADQDDLWRPDKLSLLVAMLDDVGAAYGASWIIDGQGRDQGYTLLDELYPTPANGDRLIYLFKPSASAHGMVVRRSLFSDASLSRSEPFDWLQSLDAVFTAGIHYVPDAVTLHRVHGANQNNGALGVRRTLVQRLRFSHLIRYRNRHVTARWGLTQRLEYLAHSSALAPATRAIFGRAFALCHGAWFSLDRGRTLMNHDLVTRFMDLVTPLSGSDADTAFARSSLGRMARSDYHPLSFATDLGRGVIGPRPLRRPTDSF